MGAVAAGSAGPPESVAIELRRFAAELWGNVSSYADDMLERIPEAGADDDLRGLTLGSCSSNLEAALSMVRHGIDGSAATAPATALEHARAMAARGHSVDVMLRFYRIGHSYFSERILAGVIDFVPDPALALAVVANLQRYAFSYVDRISSEVAAEYVAELDRMQNRVRAARTDAVRGLIAGDRIDLGHAERTGGEFLIYEQRPRAQSRGTATLIPHGHGLVFTGVHHPRPTRAVRPWLVGRTRTARRVGHPVRPAVHPRTRLPRRHLTGPTP